MSKFYTSEAQTAIWNAELQAERDYEATVAAYDPYADFDDDEEDESCWLVEDVAMESGLFGWEA